MCWSAQGEVHPCPQGALLWGAARDLQGHSSTGVLGRATLLRRSPEVLQPCSKAEVHQGANPSMRSSPQVKIRIQIMKWSGFLTFALLLQDYLQEGAQTPLRAGAQDQVRSCACEGLPAGGGQEAQESLPRSYQGDRWRASMVILAKSLTHNHYHAQKDSRILNPMLTWKKSSHRCSRKHSLIGKTGSFNAFFTQMIFTTKQF